MAKDLKSILAGVKSSKIAPPEIDDKNMYQWNAKDGVAFIKKHKIETHADRVGNGDDVYKGKTKKTDKYKFQSDGVYEETEEESELDEAERVKFIGKQNPADLPPRPADYKPGDFGSKLAAGGGLRYPGKKKPSRPLPLPVKESDVDENYMGFNALKGQLTQTGAKSPAALAAWIGRKKYGKEKFQAAAAKGKKLGEGAGCNHTMEGVMCEVHGESACPTKENDVNMQKSKKKDSKGREYLADKKKVMDEGRIEDDAQRRAAKELSAIAAKSTVPVTKLKPGKKSYNELKSTGSMFGGARQFAAGVAKRNIEAGAEHKSSVGKAKVGGKIKEETEYLDEVLSVKDPVSKWIHDFVHSDNPKFSGKSTKERQKMALGAYYDAKRKNVKESGSATNTDYTGPGAAGWSTGRHDMGTL
jgi:hypothetical protein